MVELKVKNIVLSVRTRAQRRAAIASVAKQLEQIRDAEEKCLKSAPQNFACGFSYCLGQYAVDAIGAAINFLDEAYGAERQQGLAFAKHDFSLGDLPF
jgi:uncharacterized hydantoinase/oxoprolinase family protein